MNTFSVVCRIIGCIALYLGMLGIWDISINVGLILGGLVFIFGDTMPYWAMNFLIGFITLFTAIIFAVECRFPETLKNISLFISVLAAAAIVMFVSLRMDTTPPNLNNAV